LKKIVIIPARLDSERLPEKPLKLIDKKPMIEWTYQAAKNSIADEIIVATDSNKIKKDRFFLEIEKKSWIIDCFKENNYPLEIAEIELSNEKEDLSLPSFISKEITGLKRYSNFSLANKPFSKWKDNYLTTQKNH